MTKYDILKTRTATQLKGLRMIHLHPASLDKLRYRVWSTECSWICHNGQHKTKAAACLVGVATKWTDVLLHPA